MSSTTVIFVIKSLKPKAPCKHTRQEFMPFKCSKCEGFNVQGSCRRHEAYDKAPGWPVIQLFYGVGNGLEAC